MWKLGKPILDLRALLILFLTIAFTTNAHAQNSRIKYEEIAPLPMQIGVAGPAVGIIEDGTLIVAGGAFFAAADAPNLWQVPKKYLDSILILDLTQGNFTLHKEIELPQPLAYSASVALGDSVFSFGGENKDGPISDVYRILHRTNTALTNGKGTLSTTNQQAGLPLPSMAGGAGIIGRYCYVVAGQVLEKGERHASRYVWRIPVDELLQFRNSKWEQVVPWPDIGPPRMFAQVAVQHDGFGERLYVIGGRRFAPNKEKTPENLEACLDGWVFDPSKYDARKFDPTSGSYEGENPWKRIADTPVPMTAGSAVAVGPSHLLIPNYATLEIMKSVIHSGKSMEDFAHPGFPRKAYFYNTITDAWSEAGDIPLNPVTTPAVKYGDNVYIVSGEVSPRVRTNKIWRVSFPGSIRPFGWVNLTVLTTYLLLMLGIGVWFTFKNKTTEDFFRGGKQIPWWVAGCSIFATMLSSITYMAVPSKAFSQDWVYWIGSFMILAVAPVAIYVALPFFRGIDATSAYEYLERRFNRPVRLIGSGSFVLFHIFRMGVVLALAALALSSVTPLSASQCVLVMGILAILYCTLGGIEAVVWTDTVQTFVLVGGALLCFAFAFWGSDPGSFSTAVVARKLHMVNLDFGPESFTLMALWVVILGGFGQNVASYTSDQAVVQRYMTTSDSRMAARSIWFNGFFAIPASGLFFAVGTAFWMFYRTHPERLDALMATDRILAHFVSQELPTGLAGLVVAGIFAAAQSTVSTSMNSGATAIETDFFPDNSVISDSKRLWRARVLTLVLGGLGTLAGCLFVDPSIKSLWDEFIGILGMFLGVLAGLFALGATTRRANAGGSLIGAAAAIILMTLIFFASKQKNFDAVFGGVVVLSLVMVLMAFASSVRVSRIILAVGSVLCGMVILFRAWQFLDSNAPRAIFDELGFPIYKVHSYLYGFVGISVCYVVGYLASFFFPSNKDSLAGLTLWDRMENK